MFLAGLSTSREHVCSLTQGTLSTSLLTADARSRATAHRIVSYLSLCSPTLEVHDSIVPSAACLICLKMSSGIS